MKTTIALLMLSACAANPTTAERLTPDAQAVPADAPAPVVLDVTCDQTHVHTDVSGNGTVTTTTSFALVAADTTRARVEYCGRYPGAGGCVPGHTCSESGPDLPPTCLWSSSLDVAPDGRIYLECSQDVNGSSSGWAIIRVHS